MMFDNCNECPNHNDNSCPFAGSSEGHKRRVCQLLKLRLKSYDDDISLRKPGELLPPFPKWLTEKEQQEMDYSRNDSKQIVNSMRPYNN